MHTIDLSQLGQVIPNHSLLSIIEGSIIIRRKEEIVFLMLDSNALHLYYTIRLWGVDIYDVQEDKLGSHPSSLGRMIILEELKYVIGCHNV